MHASLTGWLLVLVLFLWICGGLGWVDSYEQREQQPFTGVGRALFMLVWPVVALLAGVAQFLGDLRGVIGRSD